MNTIEIGVINKSSYDLVLSLVIVSRDHLIGVKDLLEASDLYLSKERVCFLFIDNSTDKTINRRLRNLSLQYATTAVVLTNPVKEDGFGGLYYSISRAMLYALENFSFKYFLKIDPDTLITGFGLLADIDRFITLHPKAGLLGSYKYTCTRQPRDFSNWIEPFAKEQAIWETYLNALKNTDYVIGEHVQGGAELYLRPCLEKLQERGFLGNEVFHRSIIASDIIFALLVRYSGFQILSFVEEGHPFAIAWQGLPLSLAAIRRKNKKVIHSLKFQGVDRLRRWTFSYFRRFDRNGLLFGKNANTAVQRLLSNILIMPLSELTVMIDELGLLACLSL